MQIETRTFSDGRNGTVSGVIARHDVERAPEHVVVLAHGAGNDMHNPFLVAVHEGLAREGFTTIRFNFPYKERGGRAPDPTPVLETCYRSVLAEVRNDLAPRRLVIGGKSLGGRMASHLAAAGERVDGLLFLGYPLHPAGRREQMRTAHLGRIPAPMLFLAGTRDPLCDLGLLQQTLKTLESDTTLHVIPDGDHSFIVLKRTGRSPQSVREEIVTVSAEWIRRTLPPSTRS
jgi:predicted alpha/beta-hydrolase family hydrolase